MGSGSAETGTAGVARPSTLDDPLRLRVFLSYSREDRELVERIAAMLRDNDLEPMWDEAFAYGEKFHDQIKAFIAHAHVFAPVLTRAAAERNWVHQEIGYAIALQVPVLPIAIDVSPGEMIQQLQALAVQRDNLDTLRARLSANVIDTLVRRQARATQALYACAELPQDRARMMAAYADDVFSLGARAIVRQKGGLSSFHIPTQSVNNPIWERRYGKVDRGDEHRRHQREERLALQRHAGEAGCKLIVNPALPFRRYGNDARICRLECLLSFLQGMRDDNCRVAILEDLDPNISVTLVGGWFSAEAIAGAEVKGYRQTIFTRHAPTIGEKVRDFDDEFYEILARDRVSPVESRGHAMRVLETTIAKVKAEQALLAP